MFMGTEGNLFRGLEIIVRTKIFFICSRYKTFEKIIGDEILRNPLYGKSLDGRYLSEFNHR